MAVLTTYKNKIPITTSRGLSAGWVYYERLKEDGYEKLYSTIYDRLNQIEEPNIGSASVRELLITANRELEKEQYFLSTIFGVPAYDWNYGNLKDKALIRGLLKDLNCFLNIPEVYQRCVDRIKVTDSTKQARGKVGEIVKITIAEFFPQYFESLRKQYIESDWSGSIKTALIRYWNDIKIFDDKAVEDFYIYANKVIEDKIDKLIRASLEKMFKSSDFNKGFEASMRGLNGVDTQAYKVMIDWINDTKNQLKGSKSFFQTVYDTYDFDAFKNRLIEITKESFQLSSKTINNITNKMSEELKGKIVKTTTATGDVSEKLTEVLTNNAYRIVTDRLRLEGKINHNYTLKSAHVGRIEAKADVVFVFEEEGIRKIEDEVERTYNELRSSIVVGSGDSERVKNVEAHNKLSENLKKVDKGFIIYSNAKNYTINKNFRGFSSGSEITLSTYKDIMATLNKNENQINTFIGAIINTIGSSKKSQLGFTKGGNKKTEYKDWYGSAAGGAIGSNSDIKNKLEKYLALDIAYFLFDDFVEIGEDLTENSVNKLHFMNLNGIYVPLSFILYLLYKSFLDAWKGGTDTTEARKYSKAIINPDPNGIKYPLGYEDDNGDITFKKWGMEAWIKQRDEAMKNTKVGLKFLSSFKEVISNWY